MSPLQTGLLLVEARALVSDVIEEGLVGRVEGRTCLSPTTHYSFKCKQVLTRKEEGRWGKEGKKMGKWVARGGREGRRGEVVY